MPKEFGISIINVPVSPMNRVVTFSGGPKGMGHIVVTKGIIRGLQAVQCPFNFNPASEEEVYPIGFFTYQIECGLHLEQLIDFKNRGVIKKILGYGIIHDEFFEKYSDEVDTLFMASPWKTRDKAISCPISANMDLFKRSTPALQQKRVTVYIKHYDFN
ncbi:MAG: hypothetical protein K2X66_06160, partial [Cyanobacteria bacterium]|nr:hypothetical protein [Cyanobacteriota bacterium]